VADAETAKEDGQERAKNGEVVAQRRFHGRGGKGRFGACGAASSALGADR